MNNGKQKQLREDTQILIERSQALQQEAAALKAQLRETILASKAFKSSNISSGREHS
jgi:hypothetical protein